MWTRLFRRVTGMDVRIASAETGVAEESKEKVADPAYATAVGILLKGAEQGACAVIERPASPASRTAEPRPGFQPQLSQAAPEFRHTPRFQQPAQGPASAAAQPAPDEDAAARGQEREDEQLKAPVIEQSASATGGRSSRRPSTRSTRALRPPRTRRSDAEGCNRFFRRPGVRRICGC